MAEERSLIVFFDLETTIPTRPGQGFDILEFGAILVCPRKLVELQSYSTLVRPADLSQISDRCNGITRDAVASAPTFAGIARIVYNLLHGRVWAGHHILRFDCDRIREAFGEINLPAPEPTEIIDTVALLRRDFGTRAGDVKMETLATYFGLGKQTHRSLDDLRMNLQVLKSCATVLYLESSLPGIFSDTASVAQIEWSGTPPAAAAGMDEPVNAAMEEEGADPLISSSYSWNDFLEPHAVSIDSISATLGPSPYWGTTIYILHQNLVLHLQCAGLKVRFGISTMYRPRLSFAVEASPDLYHILDEADGAAQKLSTDSGSSSKWHHIVTQNPAGHSPHIRLHLPTEGDGEMTTEICRRENSGTQKLMFIADQLESLFTPGTILDAYFSLVAYDFKQKAGVRLVAKKLVVHSS